MTNLIAFSGPAGCGKTTAAQYLIDKHGFVRVRFAGPLKSMMRALGFGEAEIEGDKKEVPHQMLAGKSPRYAMQTLGTEWARDLIGENFWVDLWRQRVAAALDTGNRVVCDDCRFQNEADAVHALRGHVVCITGRGQLGGEHRSEAGIMAAVDFVAPNDGWPEDLYRWLDGFLRVTA